MGDMAGSALAARPCLNARKRSLPSKLQPAGATGPLRTLSSHPTPPAQTSASSRQPGTCFPAPSRPAGPAMAARIDLAALQRQLDGFQAKFRQWAQRAVAGAEALRDGHLARLREFQGASLGL